MGKRDAGAGRLEAPRIVVRGVRLCSDAELSFSMEDYSLSSSPDPNLKRWVDTWRKAGPALERIRRQELAELDTCGR